VSLQSLVGVAVDAAGNVIVAGGGLVQKMAFSDGRYSAPMTIGTTSQGVNLISNCVTLDGAGNVFVTDSSANVVDEIPFSGGSYGTPITIGSGFAYAAGVAVDTAGNVFVADSNGNAVYEIPFKGGSYGAQILIGSDFNDPNGLAVDSAGNLFVAEDGPLTSLSGGGGYVYEIPFSDGSYGTPIGIGTISDGADGIAVDTNGNVFVSSAQAAVDEIPFSNGSYGTSVEIPAPSYTDDPYYHPVGVAVDATGNVFVVAVYGGDTVIEIPLSSGRYGIPAPLTIGSGVDGASGLAVDKVGNVFVADKIKGALEEVPLNNGNYGVSVVIATTSVGFMGIAIDSAGDLFTSSSYCCGTARDPQIGGAVYETPFNQGAYGPGITLNSTFYAGGVATDAVGNV
jgi:hypothetical protein